MNTDYSFHKRKTAHQFRVDKMYEKMRKVTNLPELPSRPTIPDSTIVLKQAKLILEETLELLEACGVKVHIADSEIELERCELMCVHDPDQMSSLDHIAKEIADVSVVTTGMFSELGIADAPVLEEVDANNLDKFGPGGYLDEHKKWRKPPNHPTPDLVKVLSDQGWNFPEVNHEKVASVENVSV